MASKFYQLNMAVTKKLAVELQKVGEEAMRAAAGSLYRSASKVMATSQQTYVPVDTGALRASGNVALPVTTSPGSVTVTLGYGNSSVDYAIHVHETDKNYKNGKQWKYLQTPLNAALQNIEKDLVVDLNKVLR